MERCVQGGSRRLAKSIIRCLCASTAMVVPSASAFAQVTPDVGPDNVAATCQQRVISGSNRFACGSSSVATSDRTTAVGVGATAIANDATAVGQGAQANAAN